MLILSLALGHIVISMSYPAHVCFSHQRHIGALRRPRPTSNFPRMVYDQPPLRPVVGRYFFFGSGKSDDNDEGDGNVNEGEETKPITRGGGRSKTSSSSKMVTSSSPVAVGTYDSAPRPSPLIVLPLEKKPFFPGTHQPLTISHKPTIEALNEMYEKDGSNFVGLFLRKNHDGVDGHEFGGVKDVITSPDEIYHTGTLAQFLPIPHARQGDDKLTYVLTNHRRISFKNVIKAGPPMLAEVEHWDALPAPSKSDASMVKALSTELVAILRDILILNPMFREQTDFYFARLDMSNPYMLADIASSLTGAEAKELQEILEEKSPVERLRKALFLLNNEKEFLKLHTKIKTEVEAKMTKQQREYMLKEQLKSIKKELGYEKDDKEALLSKFRERLEAATHIPEGARKVVEEELNKLEHLEKNSPEFNTSRNYLDWLTMLPWGKFTTDALDVDKAKKTLDEDHYGLDDVKERILEFIAVGKLRGALTGNGAHGKILCMVGPPGVGKTSIAKSVAEALGRKFYRFSVGGLSDVAEIKGHRRTYVGAMPGKVVMALKETQTSNPLILIDEIDKLGKGYQGDPASALLELLDPAQNGQFTDNFIDTPVDMSQALFLCTANVLDTIPGPLLDRMEVVRLSGYDMPEKVEIASKYLIPKAMIESGLRAPKKQTEKETESLSSPAANISEEEALAKWKRDIGIGSKEVKETLSEAEQIIQNAESKKRQQLKEQEAEIQAKEREARAIPKDIADKLSIEEGAIWSLVRWYCREAGVRNLGQKIEKICRKLALDVVRFQEGGLNATVTSAPKNDWVVTEDNLKDFVGKPVFTQDRLYEQQPPPGVVMGLAWTSMGGTSLYIEVTEIPGMPNGTGGRDVTIISEENRDSAREGHLITTGQMGDVMKESSRIAYTLARNYLNFRCVGQRDNAYLATRNIHLHVPEGATPKDGPSAGVTMVTAFLGLAMKKSVRQDVAMTGEVSLTGKVLPVGGIKEKTIAARRAGITCMIIPAANRKDMEELPDYLREGLEVHFADTYDDVYTVAFCEDPDGVASFDP